MGLSELLGLIDFHSARKVSGQKFVYLRNGLALLEMALIHWTMHEAVKKGWTPVLPPDLVREQVVVGCGFQPKLGEASQIYSIADSDLRLAGTAEIPLAGIFMNEILVATEDLPRKLVGFGHAFRTEAGDGGRESRGLYRLHQFSKVELFAVTNERAEESERMLQEIVDLQVHLFSQLGLCFRILDMATEELGAAAFRKFDIEAWLPGMKKWGEVSSASNCTDYQSRRLNIRCRETPQTKKNLTYPHMLNGTACAVPRLLIAILETFQQEDGSVRVPEVLHPYMLPDMHVLKPC